MDRKKTGHIIRPGFTWVNAGDRCAFGNCPYPNRYLQGWERNGRLYMGLVCGIHDIALGTRNLRKLAGMTKAEAQAFARGENA